MAIPVSDVHWAPSYRVISSRYPPVGLFDDVASVADLEAVFYLEGITNPRLRESAGDLNLVPPDRRVCGQGTTPIMAAFTHLNPEGSRFNTSAFGVYYAAHERDTAVAETVHHQQRFLARTREPPVVLEMRCLLADVRARLHDIRGGWPDLHDPASYAASQGEATRLRDQGSDGLVYDSVRAPGGQCVAVFYPDRISPARQAEHFHYHWDGRVITHVTIAGALVPLPGLANVPPAMDVDAD
jgi:RES domain-containing protein